MTSLNFTERVIAIFFLLWLVYLFTFNPEPVDGFDLLLGGITIYSIVGGYLQRKKIVINQKELAIYGKAWRIIINAGVLVLAVIFLPPKLLPGDISANLILGLFLITFMYDVGLRLKAWQMLRKLKDSSIAENKG